jgi:hypothetical protein
MDEIRSRVCTFAADMDNDIFKYRREHETDNLYVSFPITTVQELCDRLYVFDDDSIMKYMKSELCSDLFFLELKLSTYKKIPRVSDLCTELSDDFIPRCNTLMVRLASNDAHVRSHMTSASAIAPIAPQDGLSRVIRMLYQFVLSFIFPASANK